MVVPFAGPAADLDRLCTRLARLRLAEGDSLTVVDNRARGPRSGDPGDGDVRVVAARERAGSYFARNAGAALGAAEWLLFVDADVEAPADLLDRYFDPAPSDRTAVLAGGIADALEPGEPETAVARYLLASASMSQANTLREPWPYAQTANCAVRRVAFEAIGGFDPAVRSGGDADLCFRLRAAGWELESRDRALAAHHARTTLAALLRQRARHGAGAAWLEDRYPGFFPRRGWLGLTRWSAAMLGRAASRALRGDRAAAAALAIEPLSSWAFELGRLGSNRATVRRPA